jgi:hypothetical protein
MTQAFLTAAMSLVRFAGVSGEDVLEDRVDGLGHVGVGDGDEVVSPSDSRFRPEKNDNQAAGIVS